MEEIFKKLSAIDISGQVEKKENLSYLSWANAWTLLIETCPYSNYTVHQYDGKPYIFDENLGYMVHTSVTVENITKDMYLPVLDSKNKAMLNVDYSYTTKYGSKTVNKATMFDINTSIMRCLVKNIALFGLGLSLYRGEDIAQDQDHINTPNTNKAPAQKQNTAPKTNDKPWFNLTTIQGKKIPESYELISRIISDGASTPKEIATKLSETYKMSKDVYAKLQHFFDNEPVVQYGEDNINLEEIPFD